MSLNKACFYFLGTEEEVGVLGVLPKDCKNFASNKRPWNDCDKLVEIVDKIEPIPDEQKWRREPVDDKGWFKLTNPATNKVLTAHKSDWLSITGTLKRQIQGVPSKHVYFSILFNSDS